MRICAITSDTQSIHHGCRRSFHGDEIHSRTPLLVAGHVENLTSGTPVKLTANNLPLRNKSGIGPRGSAAGSGTIGDIDCRV
jgi:hypothetical protein